MLSIYFVEHATCSVSVLFTARNCHSTLDLTVTEAYLILENVAKKKTETVLTSSLKKLSYILQSFFI